MTEPIFMATLADIPRLLEMGERFHRNSAVPFPPFDRGFTGEMLRIYIEEDDGCVLIAESGLLVGNKYTAFCSPVAMAGISHLFVETGDIRLIRAFFRRFEEWAGDVFAVTFGVSTGFDPRMERLMKICGYVSTGMNFRKM